MARVRTFLAIDVGEPTRQKVHAVQTELAASGANVKWVEERNLHVSLLFFGDLEDRDLADVCKLVLKSAKTVKPFQISIAGLGAYPHTRRPRVVWAGVNDGRDELIRLFQAVEAPLGEAGLYRKEDRPYSPHLTLGRVKDESDGALIAPQFAKHKGWTAGVATVEEVKIMSSELRRDGPEYTVMGRAPLAG